MAWLSFQRTVCPSCGTTEADWVDDHGRFHNQPKWEAMPFRCHGCAEVEAAQKEVPAGERGVRIVLIPAKNDEDDDE